MRCWQVAAGWFQTIPRPHRRLLIVLVVLMVAFSVAPIANYFLGKLNKDYDLWFLTGWTVFWGGNVYPTDDRPFPFMYPPSAAALLIRGMSAVSSETPSTP